MTEKQAEKKQGRSWVAWALGAVVAALVLVAGVYVTAYFVAGNRVPQNAEVDGVAIGGISPAEAAEKLRTELEPSYAAPITLDDGAGSSVQIAPLESGFTVDYEGTVRSAGGGFSWNPADIVNAFRGGERVPMITRVDESQLRSALESKAADFRRDPKDATLGYDEEGQVVRTDAVTRRELNIDQTIDNVKRAFDEHATEASAVVDEQQPAVTTAMVDEAVANFAQPATSGPVNVKIGEGTLKITPAQLAQAITMTFENGEFKHGLDSEKLLEATKEERDKVVVGSPKDASYAFDSAGTIVVVPAQDGVSLDEASLAPAVEQVLTKSGAARTTEAKTAGAKAKFTTEDATKLKPQEVIGEFTTQYPHAGYRNTNLNKAASTVNGTVLMPGETFSLNDTLGERTADNGYVDGYVINGGALVKESGGGISQSATTLYNAGFFAGYEDIEHKPHSLYFDRYPAGREATVYYGKIDMRFKNNTEYPAIIQGYISPSAPGKKGSITFKIWSIKTWEKVTSTELVKSDFYSGGTRKSTARNCEPQAPIQGFTVTWQRQFWKDGAVAKSEDYKWKYDAGDRITCG